MNGQERRNGDSRLGELENKLLEHIKICDRDLYGEFGVLKRIRPMEDTIGGWKGALAIISFFLLFILGMFLTSIFSSIKENEKRTELLKDKIDRFEIKLAEQTAIIYRNEHGT